MAKTYQESRGLIRRMVRWFVTVYYPSIEVTNRERIPQSGPMLICANHANSLLDPVIIGIAAGRPVRFMAKAPLFDHPLLGPPMKALGMVPAYRGSDDAKEVRRNVESLDVGAKVLVDGHAMGIFPEGKSTDDAHLEMIRSGAARMALSAWEQKAGGVIMVPIGITYEAKERFRSAVLVRVAEPIEVDPIVNQEPDQRKARRILTEQLESRLKKVVVDLEEPSWEPWLQDLEVLVPPQAGEDDSPISRLWRRKWLADVMNEIWEHNPEQAQKVAAEIKAFRDGARSVGLTVYSAILSTSRWRVSARLLLGLLYLIILLLPAMLGTVFHLVPFVAVRVIAARMDQPGKKTISTNRLLVGAPLYVLWYLATAGLAWWLISLSAAGLLLALAPIGGVLTWHYWRHARHIGTLARHQIRALFSPQRLQQLRERRNQLRDQLAALAAEHPKND